eukprot:3932702-Rhodomonas_salina.1
MEAEWTRVLLFGLGAHHGADRDSAGEQMSARLKALIDEGRGLSDEAEAVSRRAGGLWLKVQSGATLGPRTHLEPPAWFKHLRVCVGLGVGGVCVLASAHLPSCLHFQPLLPLRTGLTMLALTRRGCGTGGSEEQRPQARDTEWGS